MTAMAFRCRIWQESYEYDTDSCTYTFHLKKDVKWHDGEPFTAKDVVFTYQVLTEDETADQYADQQL